MLSIALFRIKECLGGEFHLVVRFYIKKLSKEGEDTFENNF